MSEAEKDPLGEETFDWRATKDGKVFISFKGRRVTTLTGRQADKFLTRIESADARGAQLIMARATRNFKHGNERLGKTSSKI